MAPIFARRIALTFTFEAKAVWLTAVIRAGQRTKLYRLTTSRSLAERQMSVKLVPGA